MLLTSSLFRKADFSEVTRIYDKNGYPIFYAPIMGAPDLIGGPLKSTGKLSSFVSKEVGAQNMKYVGQLVEELEVASSWLGKHAWSFKPLRVVVVEGKNIILDGHHRFEAAKIFGFKGGIPFIEVSINLA